MICNKCKIEQPEAEFYLKKRGELARALICRTCKKEYAQSPTGRKKRYKYNNSVKGRKSVNRYRKRTAKERKDWQQNYSASGRQKDMNLQSQYNITLKDYKAMLLEQKGVCDICGNPETAKWNGKLKDLAVDHCHLENKVRALLCQKCNIGIAQFRENILYLANAISYLQKHRVKSIKEEAG